jgi:hypothetical protein
MRLGRTVGANRGDFRYLASITVIVLLAASSAYAENQCVVCHKSSETISEFSSRGQESVLHWYGSIHGEKGVTCDRCHGGNPNRKAKAEAHGGIVGPSDPSSMVNYKNLPDTCGSCHKAVAKAFKRSVHYQLLKADRLSPTCTTCHGFYMNIQPVRPTAIIMRCQMCHGSEKRADPRVLGIVERAFLLREQTETVIGEGRASVKLLKDLKRDAAKTERLLSQAQERFDETAVIWHSMKLNQFERSMLEAKEKADSSLKEAREELMKGKHPDPPQNRK